MPQSTSPFALLARRTARRTADRLARQGRRSWALAGVSALLAAPWVVRHAAGPLEHTVATAPGAEVVRAVTGPADDARGLVRPASIERGAEPAATGRHLGFDTSRYPGDRALRAWKEAGAPYEWVGFYLPAPCHRETSWSGKRETIASLGFGMAVIYVGQQTWGKLPVEGSAANRRAEASGRACDGHLVSGTRGAREGADAIARTAAEGFAEGTIVFLDVERMERMPQSMRAYYREWTRTLLADGRFIPGVYVHKHNAPVVHEDMVAEYAAAGRALLQPPVWVASGRGFSPDKAPHDVGHRFAGVWQGVLDVVVSHGGVRLPIDINVAAVPSPSAVYALGE